MRKHHNSCTRFLYFFVLILVHGCLNYALVIQDCCYCTDPYPSVMSFRLRRDSCPNGKMKFYPTTSTLVGAGGGSLRHIGTKLGLSNGEENTNYTIEGGEETSATASNDNLPLITVFLGSFAAVSVASLSYALVVSPPFPLELIGQDLGMGIIVTILAGIYLKLWTTLVKLGVLDPKDSRKIIHTGSVPLFILFWPFFSAAPWSRLFAATVPWINVFRLVAASKSSNGGSEKDLALAVSRTGNSKEAVEGPLIYCLITVLITLIFWRDSWISIIALSTMAAGDGVGV